MRKEVWLLVDYTFSHDYTSDVSIVLWDASGNDHSPTSTWLNTNPMQRMFYWALPDQPAWEEIEFPNIDYSTLTGDVTQWNFATTPEPATLTLLCVGGLVVLKRRRKR
jgi:hypothetical protein